MLGRSLAGLFSLLWALPLGFLCPRLLHNVAQPHHADTLISDLCPTGASRPKTCNFYIQTGFCSGFLGTFTPSNGKKLNLTLGLTSRQFNALTK